VPDLAWVEVYKPFRYYLVRGVGEVERLEEVNPRVLRFDVVEGAQGGADGEVEGVVFGVREYTEGMRRRCVHNEVVRAIKVVLS
jgi:hypothetical protein